MSSIQKRDASSFRVMFRHVGKQRSLTFNSLKAAQKWKALFDAFGYDEAMAKLDPSEGKRLTLRLPLGAGHGSLGCILSALSSNDQVHVT